MARTEAELLADPEGKRLLAEIHESPDIQAEMRTQETAAIQNLQAIIKDPRATPQKKADASAQLAILNKKLDALARE